MPRRLGPEHPLTSVQKKLYAGFVAIVKAAKLRMRKLCQDAGYYGYERRAVSFIAKASVARVRCSSAECHYVFKGIVCGNSWNFNMFSEEI